MELLYATMDCSQDQMVAMKHYFKKSLTQLSLSSFSAILTVEGRREVREFGSSGYPPTITPRPDMGSYLVTDLISCILNIHA
jgi:hypothetical protein